MAIYQHHVLPWLINLSMQNKAARAERERLIPLAYGTVLEVGIGSGLNVPFYSPNLEKLYALEPSSKLQQMARKRATGAPFPVEFIGCSGEDIPMDDKTIDTVVTTWTPCTIPNPVRALREMKRVLKPGGQLIFVEHGRSPDASVLAWQNRLTPLWIRLGGGCHLNRKIDDLIVDAGLCIARMETEYSKGLKPFAFLYRGVARPAQNGPPPPCEPPSAPGDP